MDINSWVRDDVDDFVYTIKNSEVIELRLPKTIHKNKAKNIFKNLCRQTSNEVKIAFLKNAQITGYGDGISGHTIRTRDNTIIDDLNSYWSESSQDVDIPITKIYDPSLLIAQKWGGWNYFHWLHTCLPKLGLASRNKFKFDRIICNSISKPFIKETLDLLNIHSSSIIELSKSPRLSISSVIISSSIGYGVNPDRFSSEILKEMFSNYISDTSTENIYVQRSDKRKISNEQEMRALLKKHNYTIINSENLSFKEQIDIFSKAKNIISAHGAGLSNIVFSNSKTKVLEIFSPTYIGLCYWLLADSNDLDYYYLIGEGKFDEDSNYWYSDGNKDIIVDIDKFKKTLELMEG